MPKLAYRATNAAGWSAVEIGSRYGVQFVVLIVLARLLTPADYGLIAMLLVFVNIGQILANAGFGTALVQRQGLSSDDEATVFWFNGAAGLAVALVLYSCAAPIAAFYHQSRLIALTHALAWVLPLAAWGAVPDALLTKRLNFRARAGAQVAASIVSGAVAITMALLGFGVWSLVAQALVTSGLRSILVWMFSRWWPRGRFRYASFRNLFGFGGFMLLAGLLNTLSTRVQALVIGYLFDAGTLGYYTLAQNASDAPKSLMSAILGRVGLPVFSEIAHDKARLREALQRALRLGMFMFVPCMVGIAVMARPLINLVYGPRWVPAALMLTLLALAGTLWPIHVLNLAALNAQGRSDRFFRLDVFKTMIIIAATLIAAHWGAVAVAASMLASSLCGVVINTWFTHRMLDYGLVQQLTEQWPTLLMALLAALPAWAVLHWSAPTPLHTVFAIIAAAAIYLGLAASTRCTAWIELQKIAHGFTHQDPPTDTTQT